MEITADQAELFPGLEPAPKTTNKFLLFLDAMDEHGPLLSASMAATACALTKQRMHTLIVRGQIGSVVVAGRRYVPVSALEAFMALTRKTGRPSFREKFAVEMAQLQAKKSPVKK